MTQGQAFIPQTLPRRTGRWKTVLMVLVVFVSGLIIGGAGATIFIAGQVRYAIHHPQEIPGRMTARLTRRLSLDADQSAQVKQLLTERLGNLERLREQIR